MGRRGIGDRVFGGAMGIVGVLAYVAMFAGLWVFAFFFLLLASALAQITVLWPAALGATLVALFLVWLARRVINGLVDGTIATFGNESSRRAITRERARDPLDIIVSDEETGHPKRPGETDMAFRLRQLAALRGQGLITPDDHERRKREILDEM